MHISEYHLLSEHFPFSFCYSPSECLESSADLDIFLRRHQKRFNVVEVNGSIIDFDDWIHLYLGWWNITFIKWLLILLPLLLLILEWWSLRRSLLLLNKHLLLLLKLYRWILTLLSHRLNKRLFLHVDPVFRLQLISVVGEEGLKPRKFFADGG